MILAYTFRADTYCPDCIIGQMVHAREASPAAHDMGVEEALDQIAAANAIDRHDEHSFDSDDFPKVIVQADEEIVCGDCGDVL